MPKLPTLQPILRGLCGKLGLVKKKRKKKKKVEKKKKRNIVKLIALMFSLEGGFVWGRGIGSFTISLVYGLFTVSLGLYVFLVLSLVSYIR